MSPDDQDLSSLIREHATRHTAPDALRAGICAQVALADAGRSDPPLSVEAPRRRWSEFRWRTASISFALGVVCSLVVPPALLRMSFVEPLEADLVADHVRALQTGPLAEVVSTDRHTVKPWFQSRVDYAPPVYDFASDDFLLMGGRIEHVRGKTVATLIYSRNRHVVTVFVWPSAVQVAPVRTIRKGFNVLQWADGSMQFWAVSDLERGEMERFTRLWLGQSAKQ